MPRIRYDISPTTVDYERSGGPLENGIANFAQALWQAPVQRAQIEQDQQRQKFAQDQVLWDRGMKEKQYKDTQDDVMQRRGQAALQMQEGIDRHADDVARHEIEEMNRNDHQNAELDLRNRVADIADRKERDDAKTAASKVKHDQFETLWKNGKDSAASPRPRRRVVDPYIREEIIDPSGLPTGRYRSRLKTHEEIVGENKNVKELQGDEEAAEPADNADDGDPVENAPSPADVQQFQLWSKGDGAGVAAKLHQREVDPYIREEVMDANGEGTGKFRTRLKTHADIVAEKRARRDLMDEPDPVDDGGEGAAAIEQVNAPAPAAPADQRRAALVQIAGGEPANPKITEALVSMDPQQVDWALSQMPPADAQRFAMALKQLRGGANAR